MVYEFLYLVVAELGLSLSVFLSFLALQGYIIMSEVILNNLFVYAGKKTGFSTMSNMSAFFS